MISLGLTVILIQFRDFKGRTRDKPAYADVRHNSAPEHQRPYLKSLPVSQCVQHTGAGTTVHLAVVAARMFPTCTKIVAGVVKGSTWGPRKSGTDQTSGSGVPHHLRYWRSFAAALNRQLESASRKGEGPSGSRSCSALWQARLAPAAGPGAAAPPLPGQASAATGRTRDQEAGSPVNRQACADTIPFCPLGLLPVHPVLGFRFNTPRMCTLNRSAHILLLLSALAPQRSGNATTSPVQSAVDRLASARTVWKQDE